MRKSKSANNWLTRKNEYRSLKIEYPTKYNIKRLEPFFKHWIHWQTDRTIETKIKICIWKPASVIIGSKKKKSVKRYKVFCFRPSDFDRNSHSWSTARRRLNERACGKTNNSTCYSTPSFIRIRWTCHRHHLQWSQEDRAQILFTDEPKDNLE